MQKYLYLFLCFMLILSSIVRAEIPQEEAPVNWWQDDMIVAKGQGFPPEHVKNLQQARYFARHSAMLDGYRRLAEIAGGVQITANDTGVKAEIKAIIVGAKVLSEEYDEVGNCTVTLQVPIYGVTNSFASAVLKPTTKEKFPEPSQKIEAQGNYTGVIIDCGDLELNPVLTPTIKNADNQTIYSYNNLDSEQVIAKGMVSYRIADEVKTSGEYLLAGANTNSPSMLRAGSNPVVCKAIAISADGSSPVISNNDADMLLSENQVSHLLDQGLMVFTSNRIRGMRM